MIFQSFLCHAGSSQPLWLLLDGYTLHYYLEVAPMARENEVIIFTFVPHTMHEMQPLDKCLVPSKEVGKRLAMTLSNTSRKGNYLASV